MMMDRNLLEQFLTDQALGQLPTETTALLDAYLADHPELASLAEAIQETAALGEQAVKAELPKTLPAFPKERMLEPVRPVIRKGQSRWLSVAASLLIGIGLGSSALLWRSEPVQQKPGQTVFGQVETLSDTSGLQTARAFWSGQTYREQYEQSRRRKQQQPKTEMKKQIEQFKKRGLL